MNAFTSPELVAFHITVRAENALEAADLLTDFTARPRIDPNELESERGVVIQEIARSLDQPAALADLLIDRAAYGEHPLGRPVLGTEERLRSFARGDVLNFRARHWSGARGGVFLAGNLGQLDDQGQLEELFGRFPGTSPPPNPEALPPPSAEVIVEQRDSRQSHLRIGYRPPIDMADPDRRAALAIYATLLGGSMGSRLVDEIREQRGLAYSVSSRDYTTADGVLLQLSAGLESANCLDAYRRMREIVSELAAEGPTEEEVERVRAYAAGRRILSFESTLAVARHAAEQTVVFGDSADPDQEIDRLDSVTLDDVVAVARSVDDNPAIACVGPHRAEDFA